MELKKAIELRTSVRSFLTDAVPEEDIREMVRLAGLAPSVNNFQPWGFILIRNKKTLQLMSRIVASRLNEFPKKDSKISANIKSQVEWYSTFFKDAPAVIAIVLEKYETVWEKGTELSHDEINQLRMFPDIQSTGACIQNILLAATDMGYGACWMSGPMVAGTELESLLGIQKPSRLPSFVAIGKPAKNFQPKEKEDISKKLVIID
jgi:nitroreductase